MPPRRRSGMAAFVARHARHCATTRRDWPADMDAVRCAGTSRICSESTRTPHVRQGDLVQLQQIAATYPSRERFLTEVTLDPPAATSDQAGVPLRTRIT